MHLYKVEICDNIQNFDNKNIIHVVAGNENEAKEKIEKNYYSFIDDSFNSTWETKVLTLKIISITYVCYVDII